MHWIFVGTMIGIGLYLTPIFSVYVLPWLLVVAMFAVPIVLLAVCMGMSR